MTDDVEQGLVIALVQNVREYLSAFKSNTNF